MLYLHIFVILIICYIAAKKAFLELGELLQRTRRNDYWDTFSLYLENTENPAIKDKNLAKKLSDNRTEGEKRLAAVFEKYTKKQEIKEQNEIDEITNSEDDEEDEEAVVVDKNKSKDDLSVASLSEMDIEEVNDIEENSDNEEDINEKVKDNRLLVKNDINNTSIIEIRRTKDKVTSNKTILDSSQQKYNKTDEVKTSMKENNMVVPKNTNQTTSKKTICEVRNNNTVAKNVMDVDAKTTEDSLPICSTADCTYNINRIEGL